MKNITVKVKKLVEDVELPKYATEGAACFDIAASEEVEWCITRLSPDNIIAGAIHMVTAIVPTGLAFEIPEGYRMDIYPRSGLAFKFNIQLANGTAKIDSDYRGEVKVKLIGFVKDYQLEELPDITKGFRIAQAEVNEVIHAAFKESKNLSETKRGEKGFGSTGH